MAEPLSASERGSIWMGLRDGYSFRELGRRLGRAPSTICREVQRNGGRARYDPRQANRRSLQQRARPKRCKLDLDRVLRTKVVEGLRKRWSPEQVSRRLRQAHPHRRDLQVSHETIYQSLYVQGRGSLRKELKDALRSGRAKRRPQGQRQLAGRIPHMVMISERPPEVEDRAVPGHWEGDLILGQDGLSQIGTLVERTTRFVILLKLEDRRAETVRRVMARRIRILPRHLKQSITWDQGKEMSQHGSFTIDTGVQVYFCDPYSPWQRGSNENTNGLLRQYFPKGTDLSHHSKKALARVARELNGRPRKTLGWMTPAEKFAQLVATTA